MSGMWGNNFRLSIFGESHGEAIGITIDGIPSGFEIDIDNIKQEMERRAPGRNLISTQRKEGDVFEILSGMFNGKATGTPLCSIIRNKDKKSRDYSKMENIMRPGHADYPGVLRYRGFNDYRGGGHFSGRITAPLVFSGAIAKQILKERGIKVLSHIKSIAHIEDENIDYCNPPVEILESLKLKDMAVINDEIKEEMKSCILNAKKNKDSVGGVIECIITGIPGGVGNPFFDSLESTIAHLAFSVPAVKGIEFGCGFEITKLKGSESNDEYYYENQEVKTYSNNNGGVTGGISNGMPVVFRVAIKPTASILKPQRTIDISKKENTEIEVEGRHDPCIVQRAVPVIEAIAAIAITDLMELK
ncbi:chorismate synthase [Clostridium hydrogeniformans]|uniref:chorismate synthase n=1 Tax=Clostridium hydrogeniformans TaxID=349933 RepID=UPI0004802E9E|nr:chorismate synthase [Clostridium hydrogeniformans]